MSYPHRPYYPSGEDDDAPSSNRPAPSRGQTLHSTWAYNLSAMPGANSFPQIYNPGGDLLGEQNNSGHYHRQSNPDPVTGRQQPYGGQYPHSASSMSSSALSYSYNPRGTASTPHPPPHQRHPDGIQQGPLDAQGGRWRDDDPLPPGLKPDYASYAQGEMPESRRTQGASSMLRPNMPNSGYLNMKNARQDDGSITYHAFGNANDGIGDVRSSKEELSSQLEPLGSAMMRFDGNATMDMSNTAPLGNHWGPITGKLSQWTNATLQTPRVNPRYEPSGVPTYNQHNSDQPLGSYTPTNPVSQPPQPWLSTSTEGSLNKDRTYLDPTSAFTHGEPRWRNVGTAPDNAQVLTHHSSYVNKFQADQLPETHLPLRTMPSRSGQPPSVLAGATNQTNDASTKAGHTLHPEHATSDVIDPHPPTSRRTNVREPAKSNVAPDPRPTKRKRSQSSSPPRKSNQRKGRKLGPSSEYEKSKKAFVREKKLACDHCKAHKTKCEHWDQEIFRSHYEASNAPNTPTSHATAPETRRAVRRPRPPASTRALAPSWRLETTQTSSSPTLLAYPGQTDWWGDPLAQIGEQLEVPARLTSPVTAAAVLQGYSWHQSLANLDTMTHTASESMHGPVRPMQSPFTAGETPSQETAMMQMGTHFGPHTNTEQQFPTSTLLSELDEVNERQQYPPIPNYDFTLLSPPDDDWDPSPSS